MDRQDNYIFLDDSALITSKDVCYLYKYASEERKEIFSKQFTIENNAMFYSTNFPSGNQGNF